jgi:hypothetical protein
LAFMLLDMTLYVNPALLERRDATKELLRKYCTAIESMEGELTRYELFSQWVSFYQCQEWARESVPFAEDLKKAEELLRNIDNLSANKTVIPSPQTQIIAEILRRTIAETGATQEQAASLLKEARRKDSLAAADAEFRALLGLASCELSGGCPFGSDRER